MSSQPRPPRRSAHRRIRAAAVVAVLLALLLPAGRAAAAEAPGQVTWAAAPADTSLGKARTHYAYTLDPGSTLTDAMAVVNRSSTDITLRVYASDAFSTAGGGIDLLPAARKPTDVGSWVRVKTGQITLRPQQSAVIPFTVSVPANATPGDHSGGVVTSLVTGRQGDAVQLDRRLGSRLFVRVTGALRPAMGVSDVHVDYDGTANPVAGGVATVTYTVTNTGNVRLAAGQRVRISSPFSLVATTAELADLPELLPGNALTRTATVEGVWPGTRLTAAVSLQPFVPAGAQSLASGVRPTAVTASATAWAWPLGQLLVVAVLVVGLVLFRRHRRAQAAKVQAAIRAGIAAAASGTGDAGETQSV